MITCPNCEKTFHKDHAYCPNCGQKNKKLDLRFRDFINDFISGAFNLDSKFFQTFKVLILYPGKLSKLYLQGKRTKYLQPVRIYLIVSLVYFTLLSFLSKDVIKPKLNIGDTTISDTLSTVDSIGENNTAFRLDSLGNNKTTEEKSKQEIVTLDNLGGLESMLDDTSSGDKKSGIEKVIRNRAKSLNTKEGRKEFSKLFRNYVSMGMFILMPLTALIFYLMFYKGRFYVQHLVFVLHLQSLMFVFFIVMNLIELLFENWLTKVITLSGFLILLISWVKNFNDISWGRSIGKSVLFLISYGFLFLIFILVVSLLSAYFIA